MAKKKEVWVDNAGDECPNELSALDSDYSAAYSVACNWNNANAQLSEDLHAAIDALHEYAHRADTKDNPPDTQKDQPARPTLDEIRALQEGDEVMISGAWFRVHASGEYVHVDFGKLRDWVTFAKEELAAVCQGIRRRGQ